MSFMATDLLSAPVSAQTEWRVLAEMLTRPERVAEIIGLPVEQRDFSSPDTRVIFATAVERHYAAKPIDALIVAELIRAELAQYWSAEPSHVGALMEKRVREATGSSDSLLEHAERLRQLSTKCQVMDICQHALGDIADGKLDAAEIADRASTEMMQATAGSVRRSELLTWMDTGRQYVKQLQQVQASTQQGIDLGVMTGLPFVDTHTAGLAPGELCFIASEPGAGKTALAWACALGFAARQMRRGDDRVGTLILSMEMGLYSSTMRLVSSITGIEGGRLRRGDISPQEYTHILREWKLRQDLPIFWNFASNFRLSQARALISEAIRKHNTGFVVIDHFRMLDTDRRYQNGLDADEAKVRFLKENIAKDQNVAVMCLAHTVKVRPEGGESARPRLSDLRGSGMITAFADQVGFIWSPYKYMTRDERMEDFAAGPDSMSIEWSKNRFGSPAQDQYRFSAATMTVAPNE
jgi:replicative DNA helicase